MDILDIGHSVKQLRKKFAQSTGLPLREALSAATIATALRAEGVSYRCCLLDPVVTVWAFLLQILDTDRTCRKALGRIWAYLSARMDDSIIWPKVYKVVILGGPLFYFSSRKIFPCRSILLWSKSKCGLSTKACRKKIVVDMRPSKRPN